MKKTLALTLALLVLLTALPVATGTAAGEKIRISYFAGGSGMPAADADVIRPLIEEALGIELEWNIVTSEYDSQLNIRLAGGTPPDIFAVNRTMMPIFAKQGLLLDLEPYLDRLHYVPQEFTQEELDRGRYAGKLYSFARRKYLNYANFHIRMDWLENLGLPVPTTLEEYRDTLIAFTNNDPDGNGKNDTYGYTGEGLSAFSPFYGAYGTTVPGQFMVKDGKVVYSTIDPATKDAIAYIKTLVEANVLDPEIMTNTSLAHQQKAFKGECGAIKLGFWEIIKTQYAEQIKALDPKADWQLIPAPIGPAGSFEGSTDAMSAPGYTAVSADLVDDPAKLDKVLELFDFLTDPNGGARLVQYGVEGVHYNLVDGKVVATDKMNDLTYTFNYQLAGRDDLPYLLVKYPYSLAQLEFSERMPLIQTYNSLVTIPETVTHSDIARYSEEEVIKFIYGQRSLDEWDQFVDTLFKTYNLQDYLDQAEADLREAGLID